MYVRGRLAFLFEVDWTAMVGEAILDCGRQILIGDQQARFLVIPAERTELLRLKLQRSPWLRDELERQNWHILSGSTSTRWSRARAPGWNGSSRSSDSTRLPSARRAARRCSGVTCATSGRLSAR